MPSNSLPGTSISRGNSEPPVMTIASYSFNISSTEIVIPTSVFDLKVTPSASIWDSRLSIKCFSILKSGMPYRSSPPRRAFRSYSVTLCPTLASCCEQANPAGPEPTTATFFPVFRSDILGSIQPSSQPRSIIAHSILLMVTGLSVIFKVHAASHGAGHILPVNSGKLLVECNVSRADRQFPS